ncbi:MAG: histidine phosphatase family protein [Rhodocyclaceae bacterium]|nr:histidine phosphatase family protein [Rhodocyclaceae bacterium]
MTVRICLVRHGETAWNAERRLQGHSDVPLNAVGEAQASATASQLAGQPFDAIYTSDLCRARQTARACAEVLGLVEIAEPALRERHFGKFQGLTYDEARERHPAAYRRFEARDPHYDFDGGESLTQFYARISAAITGVADRHPGGQLLVVAHGGVLDCINRMIRGLDLQPQRDFLIPNAALNWVRREASGWTIEAWAQQAHLDAARDELPNA